MIMLKYFLFLLITITLGYSQLTDLMKIVSDGKSNALVTDVEKIGNYLYMSVVYDTTINNRVQKKTQILQVDFNLNILKRIYLNTNAKKFFTYNIFPLKNPITQETYLGLTYTNIYEDSNYMDSVATVGLGFVDLTTYNFFSTDSFLKNFYNTSSGSIPINKPQEILVVNDTLIFAVFTKNILDLINFTQTEQKFIASFGFNGNIFSFKDSIIIVNANNSLTTIYVSLFEENGNSRVFTKKTSGEIKIYGINSALPINISLMNSINNNYLPYFNGSSYDHGLFNLITKNDTLLDFAILGTNYNVADVYLYKRYNTTSYDSMFITKDSIKLTLGNGKTFIRYASAEYPAVFIVIPEHLFNINLMNELSANYDLVATDSNYFSLYNVNVSSLKKKWDITLGNDAFYGVCGVFALTDSSCIVYGWRFPLGDTTRTDGDAFIWKISWNSGIVTSVLGETPEYVFKIFPNPASERLQVQGKTKHATTLLLRSLDGKELLRKEFSAETTLRELDVSNLSKGIYLLEIQTSSGRKFTEKVVIE